MTLRFPGVWTILLELFHVLNLFPHVGDGELAPLWDMHGGDLVIPKDIFLATHDLMKETDGAVLFLR